MKEKQKKREAAVLIIFFRTCTFIFANGFGFLEFLAK